MSFVKRNNNKSLVTIHQAEPEALLMETLRHEAVADRCTALLAKASLDNAAALCAYSETLREITPAGSKAYEAILKAYTMSAVQRIMNGGADK